MQITSEQIDRVDVLMKKHSYEGDVVLESPFFDGLRQDVVVLTAIGIEWLIDHDGTVLSERTDPE